jgi:5-hydroxyisourate hydrolase-like protein (transthyretin family)
MGRLTTHVLDLVSGSPASGMRIDVATPRVDNKNEP